MADTGSPTDGTAGGATGGGPTVEEAPKPDSRILINTHYVKDLSFENPNAPTIFAQRDGHQIKVSIDITARNLQQRHYEVTLAIKATAVIQEATAFIVELEFAGLVTVGELVPEADLEPLLSIEVPRYLCGIL